MTFRRHQLFFGYCATPFKKFVQVLVKKLRKLFRFFCIFFVLWANLSIFLARMMLKSPTVAMIPLLLPLATVFGNGGVFRFWFWAIFKHVGMVKIQYIRVEYKRLEHCTSNGMLHVAIGDPVRKWRIFELFWPKSRILYFRTRFQLNPSSYIKVLQKNA